MRAGTIVASNYLGMARVLAESFVHEHPDDTFVILVVDDLPVEHMVDADAPFELVRLADLPLARPDVDLMRTIYEVMELSTAVKPSFLKLLLDDDPIAVYLDPDIYVYGPFGDLVEPATSDGIVLTPHVLEPIPRDGLSPDERIIMQSGIFNLGFIAVSRGTSDFLEWWQQRLLVDSVSDVEANLFTDQRWIDWVPALWGCHVCRHPGMNIAWWNVHERRLTVAAETGADGVETITAGGEPLRFVHFSGFDPRRPDVISKHSPRPRTGSSEGTAFRALADRYGDELRANGHDEQSTVPYEWSTTEHGADLSPLIRGIVRRAVLHGERTGTEAGELATDVPLAFGPSAERFESWLAEEVAGSSTARLTRLEAGLWEQRPDLRAAFPDRDGVDAPHYRYWLDHDPSARTTLGERWRPPSTDDAPPPGEAMPRRIARRLRRELSSRAQRVLPAGESR